MGIKIRPEETRPSIAGRLIVGTIAVGLLVLALVTDAQAATCADYPNQAAAQRAANTRDADGDGRYCEHLPCPCAGPGTSRPPSPPPAPPSPPRPPATRSCAGQVVGPALVRPGAFVTYRLRGFGVGCRLYATVEPRFCHGGLDRCVLGIGLGPTVTIRRSRAATLRFRWPRRYIHIVASTVQHYHAWPAGSQAVVRMNLAAPRPRPGCRERASASIGGGGIVCAARTVRIR